MSDVQGLLAAACGALPSVFVRGQVVATLCVTLTACECVCVPVCFPLRSGFLIAALPHLK